MTRAVPTASARPHPAAPLSALRSTYSGVAHVASPSSSPLAVLLLGLIAPLHSARAQSAPPSTPKREVADTYFGTVIADPYRWMEPPVGQNPEFMSWLRRAERLHPPGARQPSPAAPAPGSPAGAGGRHALGLRCHPGRRRWFYLKLASGEQVPKLYLRDPKAKSDRILLDPDTLPKPSGSHWAIDYIVPAPDGRLVGYGASLGGSEHTTLYLMDPAKAQVLPDSISRVQFGIVNWEPGDKAFYYNQLNQAGDTNPDLRYRNSAALRHVLGQPFTRDSMILGPGTNPSVTVDPDDFPVIVPVEGSPFVYAIIAHGVKNEVTLVQRPGGPAARRGDPWRKLVDVDDGVTQADFHGWDVYLLSHKDAPRFKVLRIRADHPISRTRKSLFPKGRAS